MNITDMKAYHYVILCFLFLMSCKKETIIVPDNDPPIVSAVPLVKIENYVNRVFIDLIGREPIDNEMSNEVAALRAADLSNQARLDLIQKLQTSTDFIEGDTSYQQAYYQYLYNVGKIRLLEGASDAKITERIENDNSEDDLRLIAVLNSRKDLLEGNLNIEGMFQRMIHNRVYDDINMNSFNFVNATFDNLYWRFPSNEEFDAAYNMVEFNMNQNLLGTQGANKTDYVNIIATNKEMSEGIIIWVYQTLLARRPTTEETAVLLDDFFVHKDIRLIQQAVMVKDEYANF